MGALGRDKPCPYGSPLGQGQALPLRSFHVFVRAPLRVSHFVAARRGTLYGCPDKGGDEPRPYATR